MKSNRIIMNLWALFGMNYCKIDILEFQILSALFHCFDLFHYFDLFHFLFALCMMSALFDRCMMFDQCTMFGRCMKFDLSALFDQCMMPDRYWMIALYKLMGDMLLSIDSLHLSHFQFQIDKLIDNLWCFLC